MAKPAVSFGGKYRIIDFALFIANILKYLTLIKNLMVGMAF